MEGLFGDRFDDPEVKEAPGNFQDEEAEKSEEETRRVVQPKIQRRQSRPKLDAQKLTGKNGVGVLESVFNDIKFKGKGQESRDLNLVLGLLEHWAHRLYPKMTFEDCLAKIEDLGSKKSVMTYLTKIRLGMEVCDDNIDKGSSIVVEQDPFDDLLK